MPLFPGDCELQQLLHIFKLLGTPTEETWPGISSLKDWHEFPQWHPTDLKLTFPQLDEAGIDLLQGMFVYNPAERLSVSCLLHLQLVALRPALPSAAWQSVENIPGMRSSLAPVQSPGLLQLLLARSCTSCDSHMTHSEPVIAASPMRHM